MDWRARYKQGIVKLRKLRSIVPPEVKQLLRLASNITSKIPAKNDTKLQIITKGIAIADSVEETLNVKITSDLSHYLAAFEMSTTSNAYFPRIFFATRLEKEFIVKHLMLDDTSYVEAYDPKRDIRLLFQSKWENVYSATFYHSTSFDTTTALRELWDLYRGHIYFESTYGGPSKFEEFSVVPNPLYGVDAEKMNALVTRHRRYLLDKISRTYMFYGAPGTGKTSFGHMFADRVGHRLLRLEARSFTRTAMSEIIFLLNSLNPDFIVIDDVDKSDMKMQIPHILDFLQEVKLRDIATSAILTANTISDFDKGLLRPGRIDTWISFEKPTPTERKSIIEGYLAKESLKVNSYWIDHFVKITEGLTQDYLREIAQRLKYEDPEEVSEAIDIMKKLLGSDETKKEAEKTETAPN